jgi:mannose-6-phosphate isomerase
MHTGHTTDAFAEARALAEAKGFTVVDQDRDRPWGGFLVIDESQARRFAREFFPELDPDSTRAHSKLSPKLLVVAPGRRLSWQYHHRRSELWKVLRGPVAVAISETDALPEPETFDAGATIRIRQGQRHRLVGLDRWGLVAEIWQHTDPAAPSDEEDIVRVEDDYGRG